MGYSFPDGSVVSEELVKRIMKIHAIAGNAVTEGKYVIFGAGSTQLLNAAVNALATNQSSPAKVVASSPYYPGRKQNYLIQRKTNSVGMQCFGRNIKIRWALIKDKGVHEKMESYVQDNTYGDARETQLRVVKILDTALRGNGRKLFDYSYGTMKKRWSKLINIFSASERFSIQELVPKHCKYLNKTRTPSPAYAWVKCEREEDEDCNGVLKTAKIMGLSV